MSIKIRLARAGSKKRPFYRVVAADSRMPRDGRFIEKLGTYNPLLNKDDDNRVKLDLDRIKEWLSKGAQTTDRISRLLENLEVLPKKVRNNPNKAKPKKQAEETPTEEPKAEEAPAEEPKAEEAPAEEPKAEEAPAEEPKAEETPAEEPKAEEAPAEEPKAEETPAEEPKAEETPAEEPKAEEAPAEEPKAEEAPAEEPKAEETPAEEPKK
jgi:small subunit ribosomal protein S16